MQAAALTSLTTQLADARAAGEVARSERDRAQGQVKELSERLQEQVGVGVRCSNVCLVPALKRSVLRSDVGVSVPGYAATNCLVRR